MTTTLFHCISKEWFTIQQEKNYYNQRFIINQIQNDTGCSARDIGRILSSLRDLVKDKLSDGEDSELKIFPGLKVTSRYIPTEQSNLNFCNNGTINSDFLLYLDGEFSHRFKEEIKQLHKEKQWNQLFLAEKWNRNNRNKYFTMIAMNSVQIGLVTVLRIREYRQMMIRDAFDLSVPKHCEVY